MQSLKMLPQNTCFQLLNIKIIYKIIVEKKNRKKATKTGKISKKGTWLNKLKSTSNEKIFDISRKKMAASINSTVEMLG